MTTLRDCDLLLRLVPIEIEAIMWGDCISGRCIADNVNERLLDLILRPDFLDLPATMQKRMLDALRQVRSVRDYLRARETDLAEKTLRAMAIAEAETAGPPVLGLLH